jgi:putative FmdB family regulatory protein
MPLYEFKCSSCQEVSEFNLKISDSYPELCPKCEEGTLSKIISQTAFQLKGGGWFSEGYDGKSNKSSSPTSSTDKKSK